MREREGSSSGSGTRLASLAGDKVVAGGIDEPDATIVGNSLGFYRLMVDRDLDAVVVEGDVEAVRSVLAALPAQAGRTEAAA